MPVTHFFPHHNGLDICIKNLQYRLNTTKYISKEESITDLWKSGITVLYSNLISYALYFYLRLIKI